MILRTLCRTGVWFPNSSPFRARPLIPSRCLGSDVVSVLENRGLVEDASALEELKQLTRETRLKLYCGFDPTADSLHLGNLLAIVVLTWFQRFGHEPYALIGGATGRVGDPSGKQIERPILTEIELARNSAGIRKLLSTVFEQNSKTGNPGLTILDNLQWFGEMKFLTFLRDVGKQARLGTMLSKESVKTRLASESGMSFTEFSYQLLQGYDFYHLHKSEDISLQIGGSDQWGNITAGIDLTRRLTSPQESSTGVHGLTFPLLLDSEGRKFGKSETGAIWLTPEKLSAYKFFQYLYSTTDTDVIRFLRMLTFLPEDQITSIEQEMKLPEYKPNSAQQKLAEEVTKFVHGDDGLRQALSATEALRPGSETTLNVETLIEVADEAPSATLDRKEIINAFLTDVMVKVNMLESKGAVRRMIKNGGIRINNEKVVDEMMRVSEHHLIDNRLILLAAGKKNKLLLTVK
eukprot:g3965.t1